MNLYRAAFFFLVGISFSGIALADVPNSDWFPAKVPAGTTISLNVSLDFPPHATHAEYANGESGGPGSHCSIEVSSASDQDRQLKPRTMRIDVPAIIGEQATSNLWVVEIPVLGDPAVDMISCVVVDGLTIGDVKLALASGGMTLNIPGPLDF